MRRLEQKKWGHSITFAIEEWFTGRILHVRRGSGFDKMARCDKVYYIDDGRVLFSLNGALYEFGFGKSILVKKGSKFGLRALTDARIIEVAQETEKEDKSKGSLFKDKYGEIRVGEPSDDALEVVSEAEIDLSTTDIATDGGSDIEEE